jgi:hypothetical protein
MVDGCWQNYREAEERAKKATGYERVKAKSDAEHWLQMFKEQKAILDAEPEKGDEPVSLGTAFEKLAGTLAERAAAVPVPVLPQPSAPAQHWTDGKPDDEEA